MTIDPTDFGSIEDTNEFAEYEREQAELDAMIAAGEIGVPVVTMLATDEIADIEF